MDEWFVDRARRVMSLAQEEARERGAGAVGTEHVLLGLVREPRNLAHRVFAAHSVTDEAVREAVDALGAPDRAADGARRPASSDPLPVDEAVRAAAELAGREAMSTGGRWVGCEHLLLGLLHGGAAARALTGLGIGLDSARAAVQQLVRAL